jgi:hypothetical protein
VRKTVTRIVALVAAFAAFGVPAGPDRHGE